MNLTELLHGSTRPQWTARLVLYIAIIVTISTAVQLVAWWWF
jgi:hypothetical protein